MIKSLKNYSDSFGNRTRDLPACSAVPQPTAPPRTPNFMVLTLRCFSRTVGIAQNTLKSETITAVFLLLQVFRFQDVHFFLEMVDADKFFFKVTHTMYFLDNTASFTN
jgi:hypothetical protein